MLERTGLSITALALAVSALVGCTATPDSTPAHTLVAVKAAAAPNLAAGANDPVWAQARTLSISMADGKNFGGTGQTTGTLKAAYFGDMLYMLVQYKDPTDSRQRGPYQKQADGSWKKLTDPADKGGDDNIYYEDKWAMLWPINNSVKNFETRGCATMCHVDEGKPFGNKYTRSEGEISDMWHMKGSRTAPLGHVDDQYADHTRYDPKTSPNAGRKSDPGGPEYGGFPLEGGKPKFMNKDGKPANAGGTYYIKSGDETPFDDGRFKPGDEVGSYLIFPLKGDRADIRVNYSWSNGVHTSVVARKLVTGSKLDVQFDNLAGRYLFGFAAFDNAQVQHATVDDPLTLVFAR
ncbi:MAG TPA: ethylbenzene dehydrogenase-related protein [Rubrivivax sp.]